VQGRYEQAEPLYLQALELRQRLLGENHLDVAASLNNLAALYQAQGRYEQAEPLYLQALTIVRSTLGKQHPSTRTIWQNFVRFVQTVIKNEQSAVLSKHPLVQNLLHQM
jgi:tetratricopeptide (TPR) repeat protein